MNIWGCVIGVGWILYGSSLALYLFQRARKYERSRHSLELEVLNTELAFDDASLQHGSSADPSLLTVLGIMDIGMLNDLLGSENKNLADFERRQARHAPIDLPLHMGERLPRKRYPIVPKVWRTRLMELSSKKLCCACAGDRILCHLMRRISSQLVCVRCRCDWGL